MKVIRFAPIHHAYYNGTVVDRIYHGSNLAYQAPVDGLPPMTGNTTFPLDLATVALARDALSGYTVFAMTVDKTGTHPVAFSAECFYRKSGHTGDWTPAGTAFASDKTTYYNFRFFHELPLPNPDRFEFKIRWFEDAAPSKTTGWNDQDLVV